MKRRCFRYFLKFYFILFFKNEKREYKIRKKILFYFYHACVNLTLIKRHNNEFKFSKEYSVYHEVTKL